MSPDLLDWLAERGFKTPALEPLTGDVSPRRYYRLSLSDSGTALLARYPPDRRRECDRFRRTTELLARAGVRVPEILVHDCPRGLMLVEDLGPATLHQAAGLSPRLLRDYFAHAVGLAEVIARLPVDEVAAVNPPLDGRALERELPPVLELVLEPAGLVAGGEGPRLERALSAICGALDAAPRVSCHRDFMVRNLVPVPPPPALAVLDHQDLRPGPPFYDLASLFNDSLFLPPETEAELLDARLTEEGARLAYHRAAAQRTLKAVGTYAAFARRGAPRHLPLVEPTLDRALAHLAAVPESADCAAALAAHRRAGSGLADLLDSLQESAPGRTQNTIRARR